MLGVSTLCYYNRDPVEAVRRLAKKFPLVEVIAEGRVSLSEASEMPEVALSIHAPFSDINIASANEAILRSSIEEMEGTIKLARRLGATILTLHPGRISPQTHRTPHIVEEIQMASLLRLAACAEEHSVILGLENMPDNPVLLGKIPREMKRIIKAVDSPYLKMTLDVGHANTMGNLREFLTLKHHFVNIHLHDNCGQDDHRALGEGAVDLRGFFEGLGSYGGTMILELARVRGIGKSKKVVEGMLGLET